MALPPRTDYKDLHSGHHNLVPNPSEKNIEEYLSAYNKQGIDRKCKDMYEERYLRFVRWCYRDEKWYIFSVCWAEMRKTISYSVDICIDSVGVVQEAQCECGAGQGPSAHCKHVITVLYGICHYKSSHSILTEETCTQKLQTFHRSKQYTSSPLKASQLAEIRRKSSRQLIYDPRPRKCRNKSEDFARMRNACLNFPNSGEMPILQLLQPANPYAVSNDHDYLLEHPEESFLTHIGLKNISAQTIDDIEVVTRLQFRCAKWREERKMRLTASQFGRISHLTDRTNKEKYADSLLSQSNVSSRALRHGIQYETHAVSQYELEMNVSTKENGLFVSQERPYLAATPDRIFHDVCIEVKCPFSAKDKQISEETVNYLYKDSGGLLRLKCDHPYYYQVQGQLYCANKKTCHFCIYSHASFEIIEIDRDEPFIENMIHKLDRFYIDYFKKAILKKYLYRNYYNYDFCSKYK